MNNPTHSLFKTLAIASLGSALEMYDFVIYIFFAPLIGKQFFPEKNAFISLILVFSIFAVGFFCRTLGAILFGFLGDTQGRKKTLLYTITIMLIPMLILTVLPTYEQIGIAAPLLLTFMRCLQGLAVGGEFSGSLTIISEYTKPHHRGYICSWIIVALNFGILIASLTSVLITKIFIEKYQLTWAWRLAFLLGCFLIVIIAYIRRSFVESPIFQKISSGGKLSFPWQALFQDHSLPLLHVMLCNISAALAVGMIMFFPTYLQNFTLLKDSSAILAYNTFFLMVLCALIPCFGALSDRYGRKKVMELGLLSMIFFIYPIAQLLAKTTDIFLLLLASSLLAAIIAPVLGVFGCFLAEHIPSKLRSTGIGLGYNVPFALITGTFPVISLLIVKYTHSIYFQYGYIILLALIALLFIINAEETKGKSFEDF